MTTFGDLVDDLESYLYSMGTTRDKVTTLAAPLSESDLTLVVADGGVLDRGIVQINDELVSVASVDKSTGVASIHPWGRGDRGSSAVAHLAGERVTSAPRWPRARLKSELNSIILNLYPNLFAVRDAPQFNAAVNKVSYPLPNDAEGIVAISYLPSGIPVYWQPINRYRFERNHPTEGRAVTIYQPLQPGRPVHVTYRASFTEFTSEDQPLSSLGVDERWRDIIRMGAAAKLILSIDPARLQVDSVEAGQRALTVQPVQATTVARQLTQLFQLRVQEERARLLREYPSTQILQA